MTVKTLEDAFVDELRDVLHAEKQLLKALPRMAKSAENEQLSEAFDEHHQQTEEQVARLERIFEMLDKKPRTKRCLGMEGIIEEGKELMNEEAEPPAMDAVLIGAAQKVEHYEIASYGTLCAWAEQLGLDRKILGLLQQTLNEEKETDEKLTQLAEQIANPEAVTAGSGEEEEEDDE